MLTKKREYLNSYYLILLQQFQILRIVHQQNKKKNNSDQLFCKDDIFFQLGGCGFLFLKPEKILLLDELVSY